MNSRIKNKARCLLISLALVPVLSGCQGLLEAGRDYAQDAMRERDYHDMGLSGKNASKGAFYDSIWDDGP